MESPVSSTPAVSAIVGRLSAGLDELVHRLAGIFKDPERAVVEYLRDHELDGTQARVTFLRLHLPLLLLMVVASLLSPLAHLGVLGSFSLLLHVLVPPFFAFGLLLLAVVFDQMARYSRHPRVEEPGELKIGGIALFLFLPLSATAPFFFVHPLIGLLMLLPAAVYCGYIALEVTAALYEISLARSFTHLVNAALLGLIPVAVLVLLFNVMRSISILKG